MIMSTSMSQQHQLKHNYSDKKNKSQSSSSSSTLPTSSVVRKKKKRGRLLEAVSSGNVEKIIKLLFNCDANFIDDSSGETPLTLSASNPTLQTTSIQRVIVALVNGGAILDFKNKEGKTALHTAVIKNNYVALKTFLDLGASANVRDSNALTPLFYSIIHKSNPKITQLLLHEYALTGVSDAQGWQEAHHACKLGLSSHLEHLIFYGADMNAKIIGSGNTALHVAGINDQTECAKILLLRGCDTNIVNNSHQTAHQVSVIAGNLKLAEIIQQHRPEMIVHYREKPKYNPNKRPPVGHSLFNNSQVKGGSSSQIHPKSQQQQQRPSSPCLSGRSDGTSTLTGASSEVCCDCCSEDCHESSSHASSSHDPHQHNHHVNGCLDVKALSTSMRVEGRREQKLTAGAGVVVNNNMFNSQTLPTRGRRVGVNPMIAKQDSTASSSSGDTTPPITSYNEKTVSLHRGNKGFGFVLRGAKASALPAMKGSQPISLQYLDEIEEGGVAQVAGLEKGDFLLNVNGVDVRLAPHEQVVQLIRMSGDRVTMSVASPVFLQLDEEEMKREKERKEKKRNEKKEAEQHQLMNGVNDKQRPELSSQLQHDINDDGSPLPPPPPEEDTSLGNNSDNNRSRCNRAPPPAPPKRDPSTTLTRGSTIRQDSNGSEGNNSGQHDVVYEEAGQLPLPPPPPPSTSSGLPAVETKANSNSVGGNNGLSSKVIQQHPANSCESVRSDKSSPSSASIESMIPNPNLTSKQQHQSPAAPPAVNGNNNSCNGSKVASIRSRGARRLSGLELDEFMSRQEAEVTSNDKNNTPLTSKTQTLKPGKKNKDSKENESGMKKTHSTPDIQHELQMMMQASKNGKKETRSGRQSTSQEDITSIDSKGATIICETVTLKNGKIVPRTAPPSHPPPPLPVDENGFPRPPSSVLKTQELESREDSEYANFSQIKANPESCHRRLQFSSSLSSFKAPIPLPADQAGKSLERGKSVDETKSTALPNKTTTGILKPSKSLSNGSQGVASLYSRQPTSDVMDDKRLQQINKEIGKKNVSSSSNNSSGPGTTPSNSIPFIPEPDYSTSEDEGNHAATTSSSKDKMSTFKAPVTTDSVVNKVQASIREFERRSSVETTTTTTAAPNSSSGVVMTTSVNGSIPGGMTSVSSSSASNSYSNNNNLRMSRSCYEVESCCSGDNNSSSGVSSDVDEQHPHHPSYSAINSATASGMINGQTPVSSMNQRVVSSLNRRNSAHLVVSEKIASLIAQTHPNQVAASISSTNTSTPASNHSTQTLPSSMKQHGQQRSLEKRVSIADPPEQQANSSGKTVPTTAKTWSEISSQIKAVKGTPGVTAQVITVNRAGRPISAPTSKQLSRSASLGRKDTGLVNEVDVMAELVPPPPQFAAIPGAAGHKVQIQIRSDASQVPMEMIRVVNPATGQTHIVHKPQVKAPAPIPAALMQQHLDSNRSTPPTSNSSNISSSSEGNYNYAVNPQSAVARLGVSVPGHHQAAYRMLTPQQQAQFNYLQQKQQMQQSQQQQALSQQQFATLSRAYSGAQQASGQQQQRMVSISQSNTAGNRSPHLPRAQFAVASASGPTQGSNQNQTVLASQGYQQHFATLSRAGQKALSAGQQQPLTYSDLNRLSAQARLLRSGQDSDQQQLQQQHLQHLQQQQHQIQVTQQQMQSMSPQQRQALIQRLQMQQQQNQQLQQQNYHVHNGIVHPTGHGKSQAPAPPASQIKHQITFPRKSMVDWSPEDVSDWLTSIGMSDHRKSFEPLNGVKLLRLENNDLIGIGMKQAQHRVYVLEKIKQYLRYQQQHPPSGQ